MEIEFVLVTVPSEDIAVQISQTLVEERLVACVNMIPGLRSIYRWRGAVEDDSEILLLLKSRTALRSALERRVLELHPYENPEFVVVQPSYSTERYRKWIEEVTTEG